MSDIAEQVRATLAASICRGDDDDPEIWIRLALVQELLEALEDERESHIETAEIMRRAQAQRNQWKDLWRENTAQATEAIEERDEANAEAERLREALEGIRVACAAWSVTDDQYLHLDGQDLGYADAAVQILAIIGGIEKP